MKTGRLKSGLGVSTRSKLYSKRVFVLSFVVVLALVAIPSVVYSSEPDGIPGQLDPWKQWVLHNMAERLCPTNYNQKTVYHCVWPSRLKLSVKPGEGRFELDVLVFAKSWVSLPGASAMWPTAVKLAGEEVPVMNRNGVPSIEAPPGEQVINGIFTWQEMPEVIRIPANSGLIELYINDDPVESPVLDPKGRLWLQKRVQKVDKENRLEMRIFRLLDDEIPMTITSHLKIAVSARSWRPFAGI